MVVVTTAGWDAVAGRSQRFERGARGWKAVGAPVDVAVGRNGLGWGMGLHPPQTGGPVKQEGDGKAPAGVFRITRLFGYAPEAEARGFKLPYLQATGTLECVDDAASAYYNRVLERAAAARVDWKSSEQMRRGDELYRWGAVVEHNAPKAKPGGGSCIFLHVGGAQGTAGCTAMPEAALLEVLRWLDGEMKPVLVQLPRTEYERLRREWGLPRAR
jgi:D-alanyl-D-alanine dipeptidase